MIYSMGNPVGKVAVTQKKDAPQKSVTPTPPPRKVVRQCELSAEERRLAMIYGRLPFSFSKNWDARLEPPA